MVDACGAGEGFGLSPTLISLRKMAQADHGVEAEVAPFAGECRRMPLSTHKVEPNRVVVAGAGLKRFRPYSR